MFIKPTIPEPPPSYVDKGKAFIEGEVSAIAKVTQKPPTTRRSPI
jgi:hypothetical protein